MNKNILYDDFSIAGRWKIQLFMKLKLMLLLLICMGNAAASPVHFSKDYMNSQQPAATVISGTVRDSDNNPLAGVSVAIKGTSTGVASDSGGRFTIRTTAVSDIVLVFSFVGKKTVEIPYTGQQSISVVLEDQVAEIEAVVVTGFFERKAESFTGSAASFTGAELKRVSTQNVFMALRSLDPSVSIIANDLYGSDPNQLPDVDIRGKTSIVDPRDNYTTDPNQPLYIMDGFEVTAQQVKNLNVNRIESLTILKDAASTAIYGAKAANGVIVIETVKPAIGELRVNYSGSLMVSFADLTDYNLMNASEKLAVEIASGIYNSTYASADNDLKEIYNNRLEKVLSGVDTYWLAVPLRTGITHSHNLYVSGGDNTLTYGFGFDYSKTQGVMKKSGNDYVGITLDLSYRTKNDKFRFQNKLTTDYYTTQNPPVSFNTYAQTNPYLEMIEGANQPRFLEENEVESIPGWVTIYRSSNPLYNETLNYIDENRDLIFRNNFYAEWRPISGLMIAGRFSLTAGRTNYEYFKSPFHTDYETITVTERGLYYKSTDDYTYYSGDLRVIYNKTINSVHNVFLNGTMQLEDNKSIYDSYQAIGFADDIIPYPSFAGLYPEGQTPDYGQTQTRSANFFLQTGYSYANKYSIDFTLRRDGSNNFGRDNLFTTTWSTGLAWNLHRERFLEGKLELLKLRFTIGEVGNSGTNYATTTTYSYDTKNNLYGSGLRVSQFGSYGLAWEKTLDMNVGVDLTTNNRFFSMTMDIYQKITDPLIIRYDVAASTGRSGLLTNMGRNTIQGITFTANMNIINRPQDRFIWGIGINGGSKRAEYSKMENLDQLNDELREIESTRRYYNGGSPYSIWAVKSAGIDPATGNEIYIKPDGTYTFTWNNNYEVVIGNSQPDLEGRISTNLQYKGWSLAIYLNYVFGQDELNEVLRTKIEGLEEGDVMSRNQDRRALYDRWANVGDVAQFKRITDLSGSDSSHPTSRFLQVKNMLAGESISLGYSFDAQPWLKKSGIEFISISMILNDIFHWSSIRQERGTAYPYARTASLSVNVSF